MKIEAKTISQLQTTVKILFIISLLLFALSTVVMIGFIVFQSLLVPTIIGNYHDPQFIFPYYDFIQQLFFFGVLFMFSFLLIQKSKEPNASIALELMALIVVLFLTSLVSPILSNWISMLNGNNGVDYAIWYSGLSRFLYFARLSIPLSFTLYYVAVAIQLTIAKLNPQEEKTIEL